MADPIVAIDCGGTWLKGALVDADGALTHRERERTDHSRGAASMVEGLATLARKVSGEKRVAAVGVAMPGSVDAERGVVHQSPNFPEVREFALGPNLAYALENSAKVVVENDANAYAVGEMWKGAARGYRSFLCLTLGTGVGGAVVLDGRLWRGARGMAGELGHTPLHADGPPCTCGSRGCLEVYASARGLRRAFEAAKADGKRTSVAAPTPEELAQAAREGDPAAREAWETVGRRLGAAVAGLLNAFDVEAVVLGGGLSAEWDLFGESVRQQVRARAFRLVAERVEIRPAELGHDAGVLGMARLAGERLEREAR